MKNKKGGFTDLFIFMIMAFSIIIICALFIYMGGRASNQLHTSLDGMKFGEVNGSAIVSQSIDKVNESYTGFYWISWFLIVGMMLSILMGSYMVTTRPIFFVPYLIITIVAVIVSVIMSNAYEQIIANPILADTFSKFLGANFIMSYLPIIVSALGIAGAVIMFSRMGTGQQYGSSIYG